MDENKAIETTPAGLDLLQKAASMESTGIEAESIEAFARRHGLKQTSTSSKAPSAGPPIVSSAADIQAELDRASIAELRSKLDLIIRMLQNNPQ